MCPTLHPPLRLCVVSSLGWEVQAKPQREEEPQGDAETGHEASTRSYPRDHQKVKKHFVRHQQT